ncbi:MAG TPA: hypothetical protein VK550_34285 [Polyangiaceae bacterium]|nr:hypothetical protein [Polyangiaceae bacterium]
MADAGAETSGTSGAAGASGGAGGASGASVTGGAAGVGNGGATAGRAGASDAGGAAGSSSGGRAGTSSGDQDAATDRRDESHDAGGLERDTDTGVDSALDTPDAPSDTSTPPSDADACSALPTAGVYATFRVVGDVFRASITNVAGIDQALGLWRGQSQAKIPTGELECGNNTYNCGWTWRMNPASVTFAELTIEVCDATPSYVEGNCASFPNGRYCPWSAELIELRDCRTEASCPVVPR